MYTSPVLRTRLVATLVAALFIALIAGVSQAAALDANAAAQVAKLTASDDAAGDIFGYATAISDNTAIVGARRDDDKGTDSGSAYVFVRGVGSWPQQAKLTAADGAAGDEFGYGVWVSGDTAIVGAPYDDAAAADSGSAYVFVRSGTTWTQQAKLTAADGVAGAYFGRSVGVMGDTVVVGAYGDDDKGAGSGSAYVFVRSGTTWTQQGKLTAADGAAGDSFGLSAAVTGDTAVVGSLYDDDKGTDSGSAYVFVRSGTSWTQQAKLTASDGAANDSFGYTLAASGDTALVTAHFDDDKGADSGSTYVFVRSGTAWTQQTKLTASDGMPQDYFGMSVGVSGDTAVIGAHQDDDKGQQSGSAYVFMRSGTAWTQEDKITADDGAEGDLFGISVGVSGSTAIVGSWLDDDAGLDSGSAYVFSLTPAAAAYQLHYAAGAGGTISGAASQTVDAGANGTAVTAVPNTGYYFVQWSDGFLKATRTDIGITEDVSVTALFAPNRATSITIKTAATLTYIGRTVRLSGLVTPQDMIGVNIVVYVMKPGKTYWTYSSNRTVYTYAGSPASWLYPYYFKPGMARGYYKFKARCPAPGFASSAGFATSESPMITIRVR